MKTFAEGIKACIEALRPRSGYAVSILEALLREAEAAEPTPFCPHGLEMVCDNYCEECDTDEPKPSKPVEQAVCKCGHRVHSYGCVACMCIMPANPAKRTP